MKVLRLIATGWAFQVKNLTLSGFFVVTTTFLPVVLATTASFMARAGERQGTLLYVSLGAGVMGIWSSTLFGSGGAIQWQRWQGTLELVVAAPAPFVLVILPLTLATASVGVYSLASTLLWGWLVFGVPFHLAHPFLFVLAVPAAVLGLGLLGLVLASTFVLYRYANALSNMLEFPVLFVTGLLVPIAMLPSWAHPISWVLAPTWGMEAIRRSALGGSPLDALGMTVALGACYLVLGAFLLENFARLARDRATLALT